VSGPNSLIALKIPELLFHHLLGDAVAFLEAAEQTTALTVDLGQIVIRQLAPFSPLPCL